MKTSSVAQAAFLLALTAGTGSASRHLITVNNFGVTFKIHWWDDGRNEPYRITFSKRGIFSVCDFNPRGELQSITVEGEEQPFSTIIRASDGTSDIASRKLLEKQEDIKADEMEFDSHRRRLYGCSDCENTWNTTCDMGLVDVCAVWSSDELTGDPQTALKIFCKRFAKECDAASGEAICADDCTEGEIKTPARYHLCKNFFLPVTTTIVETHYHHVCPSHISGLSLVT